MDLELELVSDKAEKYGGHSVVLARVSVVALSSQPVDHDKRLMNDPSERLCPEFSDEEEEFSSEGEAEGSDSEPTLEVHRRKSRGKIPTNARVRLTNSFFSSARTKLPHCMRRYWTLLILAVTAKEFKAKVYRTSQAIQGLWRVGTRSGRNWTKVVR